MKFKFFLVCGIISNLIINASSQELGLIPPTVFTYLVNIFKLFLILIFLFKIPALRKIPTYFKYLLCFEFFVFFYGLIFNTEYYQLKNTFLYYLPQIISLPLAFIYYKEIFLNIKFLTIFSVFLLIFGFIIGFEGLALQKTFAYLYILGIIHFLRSEHKYLIIILLSYLILGSLGLESRITFIRFVILLLIMISYFFLKLKIIRNYSKKIAIISVFGIMLFLYNSYVDEGRISLQEIEIDDYNLTSDTRSLLYLNVISSTETTKDIIVGRGASAKYESHFYKAGGSLDEYRFRSEVDILNKYLYGGIFYVFIFIFSVLYKKNVNRKTIENETIAIFLVSFILICFVENTSEYSTLWLLFWSVVLNYKYDRLYSFNTHTQ